MFLGQSALNIHMLLKLASQESLFMFVLMNIKIHNSAKHQMRERECGYALLATDILKMVVCHPLPGQIIYIPTEL